MEQNNCRYNCYWDISNQNKTYTKQEKRFIKKSYKNGMSATEIAKTLKRGLWAIEVQIKYHILKRNHQTRPTKHVQKQHVQQQRKIKSIKNLKKRRVKFQNRKFKKETNIVIQTSENEIQNHVKQLMGL